MLSANKKLAKAAFAQAILTTFGKLDERDIKQIDGRIDRLLILLTDRYRWTDSFAKEMVQKSFVEKLSLEKSGKNCFRLIGKGMTFASFIRRPRTPAGEVVGQTINSIKTEGAADYLFDRAEHAESWSWVKPPKITRVRRG